MSFDREQTFDIVRSFVADSFRDGRRQGLQPETALVTSGIVDSAGVVHLVEFLERRFTITIADDEVGLANFNTLAAIVELVGTKLVPEKAAPAKKPAPEARTAGKRAAKARGRARASAPPRSGRRTAR